MIPVSFIAGRAVVLDLPDIDTDQILPRHHPDLPGGDALFHGLRAASPTSPFRSAGNPPFLLAGPNFGCGASREDAVLALLTSGIRCVIAPSFGGTFAANARWNGLATVTLPQEAYSVLLPDARTGAELSVDLERERIRWGDVGYHFRDDRFSRRCLLDGLDALSMTLDSATADAIDRFEGRNARLRPWATPP
jgi:3-isopropylmalate/(R)-2-methylmalate dehydratase small subunit